jgi:Protein of unknown function (DUF2569)
MNEMNDQQVEAPLFEPAIPKQVGGWLLVFCLILMVSPALWLYHFFFRMVPTIMLVHNSRVTVLLGVFCVLFGALAAYSVKTGFFLWTVKRGAVSFARRYLLTYLFSNFGYFCFWMLLMKPRQASSFAHMGWDHIVGPIGFFWLWYVYLEHSKRVRETYQ